MSKIKHLGENYLRFDSSIYDIIDCQAPVFTCANNYADFESLKDTEAMTYDFNLSKLKFEVFDYGFRFGDHPQRMFFVPCYSRQNGWYNPDVDVYFRGEKVLSSIEGEIEYGF